MDLVGQILHQKVLDGQDLFQVHLITHQNIIITGYIMLENKNSVTITSYLEKKYCLHERTSISIFILSGSV